MSDGDVDFFASRDNTDFEARHVGLYGSFASGDWYLDSVLTYADLDYETERFVDATSERLTGDFGGYEFAAYMEGGRKYEITPRLQLQPLASVQYGCVNVDGYTESGGASALTYNDQSYESLKGSLGARLTRTLVESAGDFHADAQVRGRWVHEFGDTHSSVDAAFASAPGTVFTVRDKDVSRDSAVFGVGLSAEMNKQTRLHVDFDTRFSSDESVHVISAALQYRW
jgi:outer membrane autotransporter protein